MIQGTHCPVCDREPHHARREFRAGALTRFDCACGCSWHEPPMLPTLKASAPAPTVHDEKCVKCGGIPKVEFDDGYVLATGLRSSRSVRVATHDERLQLTCSCGHFWYRPTLDTSSKRSPADDPMQANITLGALQTILETRDAQLMDRVGEALRRGKFKL